MKATRFLDWHRRGVRYALALTHDEEKARGAVHEAFIRLAPSGGPRSLAYWFGTIRHIVLGEWREEARFPRSLPASTEHGPAEAFATPEPGPAELVAREMDVRAAVDRILSLLTPEERELLLLADVEALPARQIARLTGRSRSAVLAQLARLRARIRQSVPNPFAHPDDAPDAQPPSASPPRPQRQD